MKHEHFNARDCARLGSLPAFSHWAVLHQPGIVAAVTCHGIFGSGDKVQTTTNTQIGASEEAVQSTGGGASSRAGDAISTQGSNNATVAGRGAIAVGNNSVLQTGGVRLGGNNSGTVTVGYDANTFQTALQTVGSNLTEALASQSAAGKSTLDSILGSLGSLAESKQTNGQSGQNKTVLIFGIALLALLGWLFYRK